MLRGEYIMIHNSVDLSPLFRTAVGFDRMTNVLDNALKLNGPGASYPPYNIEKISNEKYKILLAVAGCSAEDIDVIEHNGSLTIKGKPKISQSNDQEIIHKGIAGRAFERKFELADFLEVKEAKIADGLLELRLERNVPEELQPKKVSIKTVSSQSIQ